MSILPVIELQPAMASGGEEASSLAAASTITRTTDFVARTATIIATAEAAEQSFQADSGKVKQVTSGTATGVAQVSARIAVSSDVARTAVADFVARTATAIITTAETDTFEQVPKFELRGTATIDIATRIAITCDIARTTVADFVARTASLRGEQVTQTFAEFDSRQATIVATDFVARIACDGIVTRIARDNRITGIATVEADSIN